MLGSGREVELSALHLSSTYGGLIEGYPFAGLNDRLVARLDGQANRLFPHCPVHMVRPDRREATDDLGRTLPFGPAQWLPAVTCFGLFLSTPVDSDLPRGLHFSRLVVVWLQDTATVPGEHGIPAALVDLPWADRAEDCEV